MNDMTDKEFDDKVLNFKAILTKESQQELEEAATENGIRRRMMSEVLVMDADSLFTKTEKNKETFKLMFDYLADYMEHLQLLEELLSNSLTRLTIALAATSEEGEENPFDKLAKIIPSEDEKGDVLKAS